jgi:hypothetical protein
MDQERTVQFIMEKGLCESAQAGQHNFINKVAGILQNSQFRVEYCDIGQPDKVDQMGHSLIHMKDAISQNGLTFRRVYHYPFWQIDRSAKRWDWDVAQTTFDPAQVEMKEANRFYDFWRKRLFDKPMPKDNDGFIYMPLQGWLLERRSFQTCSPIEMIERTLATFPSHKIIATLHPKEDYSKPELDAVEALEQRFPNLELRMGQMDTLLDRCAFVVTQNSSTAFNGYFFGKPAVLFGKIDFHHIALNGMALDGIDQIAAHKPNYAAYVYWFWQERSINAGHPMAERKIRERFQKYGWIK